LFVSVVILVRLFRTFFVAKTVAVFVVFETHRIFAALPVAEVHFVAVGFADVEIVLPINLLRAVGVDANEFNIEKIFAAVVVAGRLHPAGLGDVTSDVVVDDRKLAGILVERAETRGRPPAAVIGIGLNVSLRDQELPVPAATSLALEAATTTDRGVLARALLRNLQRVYESWREVGGDPERGLRAAYTSACVSLDRQVRVHTAGGGSVTGLAAGIDVHGRLLVDGTDGRQAFGSGDVVHLRPLT